MRGSERMIRRGEEILRGEWEEGDRETVLEVLKTDVEVRAGRAPG